MSAQEEMRDCLIKADAELYVEISRKMFPHLPAPENHQQAEIAMHYARTITETIPTKYRVYSHTWLTDRYYPSGLPDQLKNVADQIAPRIAAAVGISVESSNPILKPATKTIRKAMEEEVHHIVDDGVKLDDPDPEVQSHIKRRLYASKDAQMKYLFGRLRLKE
jgi:hypothetical protein